MTIKLRHARVDLALHCLREAEDGSTCAPLLLLHELRGSSRDWDEAQLPWSGAVWALDFCGHGDSAWLRSGVYYPEILSGDADAALEYLGDRARVAGAGLGAYVALLLAGARPEAVEAALLAPGDGLVGAGSLPDFDALAPALAAAGDPARDAFDPRLACLDLEARPPDYAGRFARRAQRLLLLEEGEERPPWWHACVEAGAETLRGDLGDGLATLAR